MYVWVCVHCSPPITFPQPLPQQQLSKAEQGPKRRSHITTSSATTLLKTPYSEKQSRMTHGRNLIMVNLLGFMLQLQHAPTSLTRLNSILHPRYPEQSLVSWPTDAGGSTDAALTLWMQSF